MYKTYGDVSTNWNVLTSDTILQREPLMNKKNKWEYEDGLMLSGIYQTYLVTKDKKYLDYIIYNINQFINEKGDIKYYDSSAFNLDYINNGKIVLDLYVETKENKYKLAADNLYQQLLNQPRTQSGVFWHKKIYPNQIWLDGLYMGSVFYAKYQHLFGITDHLEDVAHQFLGAYNQTIDNNIGLCYHACDESRKAFWCDPKTGHSPHFWTRSLGWFVMAMVDVLQYLPKELNNRKKVLNNLNSLLKSLKKLSDSNTQLWYQVTDERDRPMNYLESSGSLMILNAIAKGLRCHYLLEEEWGDFLDDAYAQALLQFISIDRNNYVNVNKIAQVGGLGGPKKRDGSFAYYMSEPIVANDHKGIGPFLLLSNEMKLRNVH